MNTEGNEVVGLGEAGFQAAELEEFLAAIDGVADIVVDLREDGLPHLRVWLDGSVAAEEVGEELKRAVAAVQSAATTATSAPERKVGLGRGLSDILAADGQTNPPSQLLPDGATDEELVPALALVAVEETAGGISVRAGDSNGGVAFSPVEDPRSLNQAVVSAVARLRQERPAPRLAGVEIRDVSGDPVLTVVLVFADGRRAVGAALVTGGMPFTLGRAVWEAIGSAD